MTRTPSYCTLAAILLIGSSAHAATYYLSPSGSDTNSGSAASPFKTFGHATKKLTAGSTLVVNAGTYKEAVVISAVGQAGKPVVVKAAAGAKVIIDGVNNTLPTTNNTGMISMTGDHIVVEGFEIRYSKWYGVTSSGKNNTVRGCTIHHSTYYAVRYAYATGGTIDKNIIYQNVQANSTLKGLGAGCMLIQSSTSVVAKNNTVYNNYGNGISIVEGKDITARENLVYDNVSYNISVINTVNVIVRRNFTYCTAAKAYHENGERAVGINLEGVGSSGTAPTSVIANNIVVGCEQNIYWSKPKGAAGMENMLIANNTLVESVNEAIYIDTATLHKNSTIANNIVMQSSGSLIWFSTASGITFKNNNWVGAKPPTGAAGAGDVLVTCKLADTKLLKPSGFKLTSSSACHNTGTAIAGVTVDYFGTKRPNGPAFDIGAHESTLPPGPDIGLPDQGVSDISTEDGSLNDASEPEDGQPDEGQPDDGDTPGEEWPDEDASPEAGDRGMQDGCRGDTPDGSCSCRAGGRGWPPVGLLLGLLVLFWRRRR